LKFGYFAVFTLNLNSQTRRRSGLASTNP